MMKINFEDLARRCPLLIDNDNYECFKCSATYDEFSDFKMCCAENCLYVHLASAITSKIDEEK